MNAQPPAVQVVPLVFEDSLVLEGGDKVHINDTCVFPLPATELGSLSVTLEEAIPAFSFPFTAKLTGNKVALPLHNPDAFSPLNGYVYKTLMLSQDAPKELQTWPISIIHFEWTGVADNTGQPLVQDRRYSIQKK